MTPQQTYAAQRRAHREAYRALYGMGPDKAVRGPVNPMVAREPIPRPRVTPA